MMRTRSCSESPAIQSVEGEERHREQTCGDLLFGDVVYAFLACGAIRNTVERTQGAFLGGGKEHVDQGKPVVACKWYQRNAVTVVESRVPAICSHNMTVLLA